MHILKQLLDTSHRVRIITRSQSKGDHVKSLFASQSTLISIVVVPDQLSPQAYHAAAKGIEAIIHTASPFIMDAKDNKTELLDTAKKMALNMLEAASNSPSVKRVVLTSSLAAVVNPFANGLLRDYTYTDQDWNPITEDQAEGPILGYLASKTLAEKLAWDYVNKEDSTAKFDLVTICPSLIVGAPLQKVTTLKALNTSSMNIYKMFDVKEIEVNPFPFVVSVEDCAKAHVRAVDVEAAGGRRFLTPGTFFSMQATVDAMRSEYPELRKRMTEGEPGRNEYEGKEVARVDGGPAEEVLGVKFRGWRVAIVGDTVPALLELEGRLRG
jgi:nucleoside-diphosphate-sugar epimerase